MPKFDVISSISYTPVMGQILIRNVDDLILQDLKARARKHRTSAEEEARRTLAIDFSVDRAAIVAEFEDIARANGPQTGPSSLEILRSFRYPDGDD